MKSRESIAEIAKRSAGTHASSYIQFTKNINKQNLQKVCY